MSDLTAIDFSENSLTELVITNTIVIIDSFTKAQKMGAAPMSIQLLKE